MAKYKAFPHEPDPKKPSWRIFKCDDCDNKPDAPMLKEEVWRAAGYNTKHGLVCIACTEKRLGRQLTVDDLENCIGNSYTFLVHDRILALLTGGASHTILGQYMKDREADQLQAEIYQFINRLT